MYTCIDGSVYVILGSGQFLGTEIRLYDDVDSIMVIQKTKFSLGSSSSCPWVYEVDSNRTNGNLTIEAKYNLLPMFQQDYCVSMDTFYFKPSSSDSLVLINTIMNDYDSNGVDTVEHVVMTDTLYLSQVNVQEFNGADCESTLRQMVNKWILYNESFDGLEICNMNGQYVKADLYDQLNPGLYVFSSAETPWCRIKIMVL